MAGEMEFEGRTEEEAVERASTALSVSRTELDYTVIDEGSGGLFGLGSRPVRIRARSAGEAAEAPRAEPRSEGRGEPRSKERSEESRRRRESEEADDIVGGIVGPAPEKAAKALEVAQGLAERMGMRTEVSVRDEEREIVVVLAEAEGSTDVAEMLGSSRPPGVPSFQFLLNKIVNRFPDNRKHIVVEAPSVVQRVSERRAQAGTARPPRGGGQPGGQLPATPAAIPEDVDPQLAAVARVLAEKVRTLGKVITIHPMAAADRRAIHLTVVTIPGVDTVSEGEGLYRRIHIVPGGAQANEEAGRRRRRRRRRRRGEGEPRDPSTGGEAETATEEGPAV